MTGLIKIFETQLAKLFDKLRVSSPIVYLIILIIVFGGSAVIENYTGLAEEFPWLFEGITDDIIEALVAILLSSRTKRHMHNNEEGVEVMAVTDLDNDD